MKDGKYYIGYTKDIGKRFKEHNDGKTFSIKSRRPFVLMGFEEYTTENEARYREHQIKNSAWQKNQFIAKLIQSDEKNN